VSVWHSGSNDFYDYTASFFKQDYRYLHMKPTSNEPEEYYNLMDIYLSQGLVVDFSLDKELSSQLSDDVNMKEGLVLRYNNKFERIIFFRSVIEGK
jgi:hypothetical protein